MKRARIPYSRLGRVICLRAVILLASTLLVSRCAGASPSAPADDWLTGPALKEQLAAPVTVSWSNTPLGEALRRLAAAQHVAIVLDRRIDSDRGVEIALSRVPLGEGLRQLASQLELGYSQLGPVAYVGPPALARQLRSVAALRADEAKRLQRDQRLPSDKARKFLNAKPLAWDDLSEPRALVEALAAEVGATLVGGQRIPHDLWSAAALPPLSWTDRMTLLTAQFGLSYRIDDAGKLITLVDWPTQVVLRRSYPSGRDGKQLAERWREALPDASVRIEQNKIVVEGLLEDHEAIEQRGHSTPRTTTKPGKDVYQLSIENTSLEKVVNQLGERLGLDIRWEQASEPAKDQLISVRVRDVDLDALWRAILDGTGWTFRRNERTITLLPAGTLLPTGTQLPRAPRAQSDSEAK